MLCSRSKTVFVLFSFLLVATGISIAGKKERKKERKNNSTITAGFLYFDFVSVDMFLLLILGLDGFRKGSSKC